MLDPDFFDYFSLDPLAVIKENILKYNFRKETPFEKRVKELEKIQEPEAFLLRCYFLDHSESNNSIKKLDEGGQLIDIDLREIFLKPRIQRDSLGIHLAGSSNLFIFNCEIIYNYINKIQKSNPNLLNDFNTLTDKFMDLCGWQVEFLKFNDGFDDFESFARSNMNYDAFNYKKLDDVQYELFFHADLIYLLHLLGAILDQDEIYDWHQHKFDFEAWHSPLALKYYPEQLKEYQLMLYSWFDKELELRKKHFKNLNADFLPYEYKIIDDFKKSLIHEDDIKKWRNQYDKRDYPTSIFSSYKAFKLFEAYDEDENFKNADLSFIYYKMSDENDEDYRIIASRKQFMEWYRNKTVDKEPLEINIPKSRALEKESKRFTYRIIKKQIDKLYDLD